MDGSSPRSVIFCGISEKSRELRRRVLVHDVEPSSRELQQGTAIWRTTNASLDKHQKQAANEARMFLVSLIPEFLLCEEQQ
jgi:hypothetical protein